MTRTGILSATATAVMLGVCAPSGAAASSTLLSGYGGPGAGEQAIIGSTLLGGREKPSGAGGSGPRLSGSDKGVAVAVGRYGAGTRGAAESATPENRALGGGIGASGNGTPATASGQANGPSSDGSTAADGGASFVYPSALRSASAKSTVLGLTGGDLAAFAAVVVGLVAVGALTIRLARLRR